MKSDEFDELELGIFIDILFVDSNLLYFILDGNIDKECLDNVEIDDVDINDVELDLVFFQIKFKIILYNGDNNFITTINMDK